MIAGASGAGKTTVSRFLICVIRSIIQNFESMM